MAHGHGLVYQSETIADVALSTLAARTAIQLGVGTSNIEHDFLVRQAKYDLQLVGRTAADDGPIMIGMAKGDATVAEIAGALTEINTVGPSDTTQMLTADAKMVIWWNSLRSMKPSAVVAEAHLSTEWFSPTGSKGMRAELNAGYQFFAYNAGNAALATGITIGGQCRTRGVWLK